MVFSSLTLSEYISGTACLAYWAAPQIDHRHLEKSPKPGPFLAASFAGEVVFTGRPGVAGLPDG